MTSGLMIVLLSLLCMAAPAPVAAEDAQPQDNRTRWESMSPEDKQRIIQRYHEWKAQTNEQRERARKNYEYYHAIPREEQLRLKERYRVYRQLDPEKRERIQRNLKRFDQVPAPDMQQAAERYRRLRQKTAEEQMRMIEQSAFWRSLSEQDREIFRRLMFPRQPQTQPQTQP